VLANGVRRASRSSPAVTAPHTTTTVALVTRAPRPALRLQSLQRYGSWPTPGLPPPPRVLVAGRRWYPANPTGPGQSTTGAGAGAGTAKSASPGVPAAAAASKESVAPMAAAAAASKKSDAAGAAASLGADKAAKAQMKAGLLRSCLFSLCPPTLVCAVVTPCLVRAAFACRS